MTDNLPDDLTPSEKHFADADEEPANIAVWFYDLGFRVFPLIGKHPDSRRHSPERYPRCFSWDDYSCTRSQVEHFENYAIDLEHLIVVDTDNADAEVWIATYLPPTPFRVRTARGLHRYFRRYYSPPELHQARRVYHRVAKPRRVRRRSGLYPSRRSEIRHSSRHHLHRRAVVVEFARRADLPLGFSFR